MSLGFSEVAFIVILALLLFGPKKLPELARQVGRATAEFKRATGHLQAQINDVSRSLEIPLEVSRFQRPSFYEVLTSAAPETAPAAAREETHV
jgi:TatA/E family protein of Tat protein translocase